MPDWYVGSPRFGRREVPVIESKPEYELLQVKSSIAVGYEHWTGAN